MTGSGDSRRQTGSHSLQEFVWLLASVSTGQTHRPHRRVQEEKETIQPKISPELQQQCSALYFIMSFIFENFVGLPTLWIVMMKGGIYTYSSVQKF